MWLCVVGGSESMKVCLSVHPYTLVKSINSVKFQLQVYIRISHLIFIAFVCISLILDNLVRPEKGNSIHTGTEGSHCEQDIGFWWIET